MERRVERGYVPAGELGTGVAMAGGAGEGRERPLKRCGLLAFRAPFPIPPPSPPVVSTPLHSFLNDHECNPPAASSSFPMQTVTKPVEKWVVQEGGLVVVVPANLTQGAVKELLKPYTQYKVRVR